MRSFSITFPPMLSRHIERYLDGYLRFSLTGFCNWNDFYSLPPSWEASPFLALVIICSYSSGEFIKCS